MARKREFNVFSLSFLDIMSCGFGAVILVFIIINHSTEATSQEVNATVLAEITRVEKLVENETAQLITLKNTVKEKEDEIVTTEDLAIKIIETIKVLEAELAEINEDGASQEKSIASLKSELKLLEEDAANLEGSVAADSANGTALRTIVGQGDRQYLTGMKVGGDHILILLDTSASMLDKTIVNVIRRRNMSDAEKLKSEKWQRAIRTVEWIIANMPKDAQFQLYTFNQKAESVVTDSKTDWLKAAERADTDRAIDQIKKTIPSGGTSLHLAFAAIAKLDPLPDNIFLLVDGLPTMGIELPKKTVVESRDRVSLFTESLQRIPGNSPINVILFPMEGDPIAAPSYWRLAQITGGSFLAPPKDWP